MPDLVEFLKARLDERAAAAQVALDFEYADHPDYREEWKP